jgi:two-component system response regulator
LATESRERRKTMRDVKEVEILLVEDNPIDREIILGILKKNNFTGKIHVLKDGAEALDYIFSATCSLDIRENPKIILLDLKLTKVDGLEVLEKIRSDNRTANIPVVVLTSSAEESDIVKSYNLAVEGYILKPVNYETFINAIKEAAPIFYP